MKIVGRFLENFFEQEVPSGSVDGINASFTLGNDPIYDKTVWLFNNGLIQRQTTDYSISGNTITYTNAPPSGTKIYAIYFKK